MKTKKVDWPKVSFVVCTYNCPENIQRCFSSINIQDYPKDQVEILALDGGSTDTSKEVAERLGAKVIHNPAKLPEGKGRGKWLGFKKATGEIVVFVDSDNKLVEKDWIKQMVKPLIMDKNVNFCICRMAVVKTDSLTNRYLSLIGTDPVAAYKSIDALLAFKKLRLKDNGDYYVYKNTLENFIITGGFYFMIKKETLEKIGGYTQDTDVNYNLVKNGFGNICIPKNAHVHHLIIDSIRNFYAKKVWWAKVYFRKQKEGRDFNWMPDTFSNKLKLAMIMGGYLLFLPPLVNGIRLAARDKEPAWLMHPIMSWITTVAYLYAFITSKFTKKL